MGAIPIVITGATGYIGAQIVLTLLERFGPAIQCRVLVREHSEYGFLKGLPVEIVRADLHDPIAIIEATKAAEVVFHCAGLIAYTKSYRNRLYETNTIGTRNIVNACLANNIGRLVMTSSIAAIGVPDMATMDQGESTEETTFNEWQHRNGYMESKHLAELEVSRGSAEGLDVVMVNPGVVIGRGIGDGVPGSSSNEVLRLIHQGKIPFCPQGGTGFVDVRDVAEAHLAAWQKGRSGQRYIIVGENLAFRTLFERIKGMEGSNMGHTYSVSKISGLIAGAGGELWSLLTGRPSFISFESIQLARLNLAYSNTKSSSELGIRYKPIGETLKTIIS